MLCGSRRLCAKPGFQFLSIRSYGSRKDANNRKAHKPVRRSNVRALIIHAKLIMSELVVAFMAAQTLKQVLKTYTVEGELWKKLDDDRVLCYACGHRCVILPGLDGICRVRYN